VNEQQNNQINTPETTKVRKWQWGLAASVFVVLVTVSYFIIAPGFDIARITLVGICWQIFIGISGILLVYLQVKEMSKNTQKMTRNTEIMTHNTKMVHEWNTRIESLKIVRDRYRIVASFDAVVKFITDEGKKNGREPLEKIPKEMLDESKPEHAELIKHIKNIANYFEQVATGIKHSAYNEDILVDSMRGMFIRLLQLL
jgi:hypothetical protein